MPENPNATPTQADMASFEERVFNPVFFAKLAQHDIRPATREEAAGLLNIGYRLLADAHQKQASAVAAPSFVAGAVAYLDHLQGVDQTHAKYAQRLANSDPSLVTLAAALRAHAG